MSVYIPEAPKAIARTGVAYPIYALADHGTTGAVTDQEPQCIDLESSENSGTYHEGVGVIEIFTRNGQGATPTSPGAAATYTLFWAFCNTKLDNASDAPTLLSALESSLIVTLPDSALTTVAGQTLQRSGDPFIIPGRYLYTWYSRDAFAANALVDINCDLIRV